MYKKSNIPHGNQAFTKSEGLRLIRAQIDLLSTQQKNLAPAQKYMRQKDWHAARQLIMQQKKRWKLFEVFLLHCEPPQTDLT